MKRTIVVLCTGALLLAVGFTFEPKTTTADEGEDASGPAMYIGVEKCGMCHKKDKTGNQLAKWQDSKHSKALEALATPEAADFAKERGIDNPQTSDACLKCHETGHGEPAENFKDTFKPENGVQCESCHGPGSNYMKQSVMKDRAAAVEKGLLIPDEKTCKKCHNEESPSYKPFCFAHFLAKIYHPNPEIVHEVRTIPCTCEEKADLQINEDGTTTFVKQGG